MKKFTGVRCQACGNNKAKCKSCWNSKAKRRSYITFSPVEKKDYKGKHKWMCERCRDANKPSFASEYNFICKNCNSGIDLVWTQSWKKQTIINNYNLYKSLWEEHQNKKRVDNSNNELGRGVIIMMGIIAEHIAKHHTKPSNDIDSAHTTVRNKYKEVFNREQGGVGIRDIYEEHCYNDSTIIADEFVGKIITEVGNFINEVENQNIVEPRLNEPPPQIGSSKLYTVKRT